MAIKYGTLFSDFLHTLHLEPQTSAVPEVPAEV
jgi:hypothetical protein